MSTAGMALIKEQEDQEQDFYTIIKVARDEDLKEQIGKDIYFDLVDHDKVRSFHVRNQAPFSLFKEDVAKEFGIPVHFQRFWFWAERNNRTYRPHRPFTPQEESQLVGRLRRISDQISDKSKTNSAEAELKLFLEVEVWPYLRLITPSDKTKEDILLFFKLYEPEKQKLCYVGRLFVKSNSQPIEIVAKLNRMAGFAPDEEIDLYEEIEFEPRVICEPVDKRFSFQESETVNGDIICFQKSRLESEYADVLSFLEHARILQLQAELTRTEETAQETETLKRLSMAEKILKSTSADDPSVAALETVSLFARSSLAALCKDGAYEEFKAALKLLTEQGRIPLRITSMLEDLLESLEGNILKYYEAAEKELTQVIDELPAQQEEIKARMELAMQECQVRKDIVADYDTRVSELEAELARVKERQAEAILNLKIAVDEMEPLKQSFVENSSKSEIFTVRQAMLTVQNGVSVGTWNVVQDVLKKYFKF